MPVTRTAAVAALAGALALAAAGCGGSSKPPPVIAAGHGSPGAAAVGFLTAASANNSSAACGYVLPSQASVCAGAFTSGGAISVSGLHLGTTTVSGDRALVTALGRLCSGVSDPQCFTSAKKNAGQPTKKLNFAAAYAAVENGTSSDPNDPAIPCMQTGGMWYVDLGQSSSGASSQSNQGGQSG